MNADTLLRAAEIHNHWRLIEHEAAHAAAALALGLDVHEVTAPFWTFAELEAAGEDSTEAAGHTLIARPPGGEALRKMAIVSLMGGLEEGDPNWPRRLTLAPLPGDEADLMNACHALGLDQAGLNELTREARDLACSREYERLHAAISHLLEQHGRIDGATLREIKAITQENRMDHKLLDVVDTEVDEGLMIALASTWEVDRVKDRVVPGAYAEAVAQIKAGDYLPLVWQHDLGSPGNFVGEIVDANETSEGLEVTARFDLDDADGMKAYKLAKRGSIKSLSIGYRVLKQRPAPGGITELVKIDLYEVSLVLMPANPGARILAIKSDTITEDAETERHVPSADELRARVRELGIEPDPEMQKVRDEMKALITTAMSHTGNDKQHTPTETLRQKSERYAREFAPIKVAEFDC